MENRFNAAPRSGGDEAPLSSSLPSAANIDQTPNPLEGASFPERVMVIGGGLNRPPEAMARFHEWAGGPDARILVIGWATTDPEGSLERLRGEFPSGTELVLAPSYRPLRQGYGVQGCMEEVRNATGLYFTGGDQLRIMETLERNPKLLRLIEDRFHEGLPIAGTSAGAAIAAKTMFTGEDDKRHGLDAGKVGLGRGLGLVDDVLIDQHFIERGRYGRMIAVLREASEELGIGVPENTAVAIEESHFLEVLMSSEAIADKARVVIFEKDHKDRVAMEFLDHHDHYDLKLKARIDPGLDEGVRATG